MPLPNPITEVPAAYPQGAAARAFVEGTSQVGSVNLDDVLRDYRATGRNTILNASGMRKLREAGFDPDTDIISFSDLIESGIQPGTATTGATPGSRPGDFKSFAFTDLKNAGIIRVAFKGGRPHEREPIMEYDFSALEGVQTGFFPESAAIRQNLTQRALGLLGITEQPQFASQSALARDFLSDEQLGALQQQALASAQFDPFTGAPDAATQAQLAGMEQQIRGAYTARGLGESGAAAFMESEEGLRLLESIRQARQTMGFAQLGQVAGFVDFEEAQRRATLQEGLGLAQMAGGLGYGDLAALGGQLYQETLQGNVLRIQQQNILDAQQQALDRLRRGEHKAQDLANILGQNWAASFGSFAGNPVGAAYAGSSIYQTQFGGQQTPGVAGTTPAPATSGGAFAAQQGTYSAYPMGPQSVYPVY